MYILLLCFVNILTIFVFLQQNQPNAQYLKFILFSNNTLHISNGLTVHHQESKTVHTACRTIQVLWLLASKQPQNLYDIYLMLYVQS